MKTALAILLLSANISHAETLVALRNRVDLFLTNKVSGAQGLVAKQNAYFAANGRYWQGLVTFLTPPNQTATNVADSVSTRLALHPSDQSSSWTNFVPTWTSESFAAAAEINTYDGPLGKGWKLRVLVQYEGVIYERQKCFGPDVSDDYNWRVYDPAQ